MTKSSTVFLVVEDEPADAEFLQHALAAAGRNDRIYAVGNGEEAVAFLSGTGQWADRAQFLSPDVIITDLKMPHMNGLELLRWLNGHETWRTVPRIVLTSSTAPSDIATSYRFGAAAYLVKPVNLADLRAIAKAMSDLWSNAVSPHSPP